MERGSSGGSGARRSLAMTQAQCTCPGLLSRPTEAPCWFLCTHITLTVFLLLSFPPPAALRALQLAWKHNRLPFCTVCGDNCSSPEGTRGRCAVGKARGKPGWQEVAGLLEEVLGCAAVAAEKGPEDAACPFPELRASREPHGEDPQGLREGGTGEPGVSGLRGAESFWEVSVPSLPSLLTAGRAPALLWASPQPWPLGSFLSAR